MLSQRLLYCIHFSCLWCKMGSDGAIVFEKLPWAFSTDRRHWNVAPTWYFQFLTHRFHTVAAELPLVQKTKDEKCHCLNLKARCCKSAIISSCETSSTSVVTALKPQKQRLSFENDWHCAIGDTRREPWEISLRSCNLKAFHMNCVYSECCRWHKMNC